MADSRQESYAYRLAEREACAELWHVAGEWH
jgi:muconolactone delta-isomerase